MKPIVDEFTYLPISKQRRWQLRKEKAGQCITCGKPATKYQRCAPHAVALIERMREIQSRRAEMRPGNAPLAIRRGNPFVQYRNSALMVS